MSPIPLFPYPPEPNSPRLSQYANSDGIQSDFPPIRIHDSTPDFPTPAKLRKSSRRLLSSVVQKNPERRSSPNQSPRLPRPRLPKTVTVLGDKNLNTIQVTVRQAKDVPSKRPSESVDIDRPLKRRCVEVDEDWLKHEIRDIKERMTQLTIDMDVRLEEILQEVRQFNEI